MFNAAPTTSAIDVDLPHCGTAEHPQTPRKIEPCWPADGMLRRRHARAKKCAYLPSKTAGMAAMAGVFFVPPNHRRVPGATQREAKRDGALQIRDPYGPWRSRISGAPLRYRSRCTASGTRGIPERPGARAGTTVGNVTLLSWPLTSQGFGIYLRLDPARRRRSTRAMTGSPLIHGHPQ
jgi:hypothetical protein